MSWQLVRDTYGIPHLRADSVEELAYAQGHTAAADRAWQLDFVRRRAEGRTAELVGSPGIEWDRFSRRALLDRTGRRAYERLRPETKEFVEAFVHGVNDALGPSREHEALDAAPGRWHPWTPLSAFLAQHILFATYPSKLWRHHVHKHLGDAGLERLRHEGMVMSGSNAFAVAGGRTATGSPLIAGDPHRSFEAPNVYAQVHLACPEFDVAGLTFPFAPGVQHFGHTGSVAWAITNAMADYQDLYVEPTLADSKTWTETLAVRDAEPVEVQVVETPRGPVVVGEPGDDEVISLRWPSYVCQDLGFDAILPLLRARTAADVDAAMERWVEPVNNVVIADTTGAVLHRVAGKVPERSPENRIKPVATDHEWLGWVADLPRTTVGSDGLVVTANNRINDGFDRIGSEFSAPYRADRIASLVGGRGGLTVADLAAILTDTFSARAGRHLDEGGGDYIAARDALVERLAADEDLAPLRGRSPYGSLYDAWFHLPSHLAKTLKPGDVQVGGVEPRSSRLSRVVSRLFLRRSRSDRLEGLASLEPRPPGPPSVWPHTFYPLHALEQAGLAHPITEELHASTSVPVYGDSDCVQAMATVPGVPVCSKGPVARYVWDLADRDNSRWVVPLGASGEPGPHFADQLPLWASGRLVPVITDWDRLLE